MVLFKHFSSVLALALLLTACVTETPLSSAVPITTSPAPKMVNEQIEDDTAVQKFAMILCLNQQTFKKAVRKESLKFYGIIPTAGKIIMEIYAAPLGNNGFTIAIRNAAQDEVCIMISGSELVPVAWFIESGVS